MAKGVLGGIQPDPEKGMPYRQVRQKARLLLEDMYASEDINALYNTIISLMTVRPEETLDALIAASGED